MDWFRMYHRTLDNPKVQRLPAEIFKTWVNLLCLASQTNGRGGTLPGDADIAFRLRLAPEMLREHLAALVEAGLVEKSKAGFAMHDWGEFQYISDDHAGRMRRYREQKRHAQRNGDATSDVTRDVTSAELSRPQKEQNRTDSDSEQNRKGGVGGKQARSVASRANGALPPAPARKQYLGISPDQGVDHRSPPRRKSENVLQPIPERAERKRLAEENSGEISEELRTLVAAKTKET